MVHWMLKLGWGCLYVWMFYKIYWIGRSSDKVGLRAHIQDTCNCGRTYNTGAIKTALTRDMQLEEHLQETFGWNCTY